jgi:hypothetical protein
MTKKLEDLLNLPNQSDSTEDIATTENFIKEQQQTLVDVNLAIDKIDVALPSVRDLEASDHELDELATLAKDKFNDLMDLGMSVESRFSGPIFQTAGVLLGHAITAKQAKLDKKLRMVDLQIKKLRLDQTAKNNEQDAPIEGEAVLLDRNSLLNKILNKPQ